MTQYGKLNLLGMVAVPVAAGIASLASFGLNSTSFITIVLMNCIAVLIAGLISGLMLRKANNGPAAWVALMPILIPSVWISVWFLFRAVVPAAVAPGAEYIAAPQYHVMAVLLLTVVAFVLGFFVRSK